jgi:hypothetical protein
MNLDYFLQGLIFVFALLYKYLIAKENFWGWVTSIIAGSLSLTYLIIYSYLPIMISLEIGFILLAIYGIYKFSQKIDALLLLDKIIISLTIIAITILVIKQIKNETVWYEIIASVSYLAGIILLAQKKPWFKITGWLLFATGSICYGIVMYKNEAYILFILDIISTSLSLYGIWKVKQKLKINKLKSAP